MPLNFCLRIFFEGKHQNKACKIEKKSLPWIIRELENL